MKLVQLIQRYGPAGAARRALLGGARAARRRYYHWNTRNAPRYASPNPAELVRIEHDLRAAGVRLEDYAPALARFDAFQALGFFPPDYHGGVDSGVWDEKLLEHWIAAELLGLMDYQPGDVYVDIAAAGSPWTRALRERKGITAFAIDLEGAVPVYADLPYYRRENAVATSFADSSIRGASLHCAYEMFLGANDTALISEMARILRPGGKMVILPLYLHTHYCAYSTPEYYGKGYTDPGAVEYVRMDASGVPASRKYDAMALQHRVLKPIARTGMTYRVLALRNKEELGTGVYCHFILEVTR